MSYPTSNVGKILENIKPNRLILQIQKWENDWPKITLQVNGTIRTSTQVISSIYLSSSLLIHPSTCPFIHLFIHPFITHLSNHPYIHPSTHLYIYQFIPSTHPSSQPSPSPASPHPQSLVSLPPAFMNTSCSGSWCYQQ